MSEEIRKLTTDLIDIARLVLIAMVLIVVVYLVAKDLFGMVPATVGAIIIGLAFLFIYATNENVRDAIKSLGKR
jgi:4-amino-4-deoxy-L-arabinose transferase-like glycosyltransferase